MIGCGFRFALLRCIWEQPHLGTYLGKETDKMLVTREQEYLMSTGSGKIFKHLSRRSRTLCVKVHQHFIQYNR